MKYIQRQNRSQTYLFPVSLDDAVSSDNEVRLIDVFVDSLLLDGYGFQIDHGENGRPAYHPGDLLKLFIYGYMNRIRSSRDLEKECKRNIEVRLRSKNKEQKGIVRLNLNSNKAEKVRCRPRIRTAVS